MAQILGIVNRCLHLDRVKAPDQVAVLRLEVVHLVSEHFPDKELDHQEFFPLDVVGVVEATGGDGLYLLHCVGPLHLLGFRTLLFGNKVLVNLQVNRTLFNTLRELPPDILGSD